MAHSIEKGDKIRKTDKITACRYTNRDPNKQEVGFIYHCLCMKRLRAFRLFKYPKLKLNNQKFIVVMSFSRPTQWYHSHAYPISPDSTFNFEPSSNNVKESKRYRFLTVLTFSSLYPNESQCIKSIKRLQK
jgi:hypothetical protein